MGAQRWEDFISLRSHEDNDFEVLGPAAQYRETDGRLSEWANEDLDFDAALARDRSPLPVTADREGYYGPHHFSYWASGLRDARNLMAAASRLGVELGTYLDFGCASGRVVRHFLANHPDIHVMGCDINRRHVEWCCRFLPGQALVFQNHSIPNLPLPDESVDMVSAFSVFTHIEAFETSWLMELRRILKPGGLAWITVHTDLTLAALQPTWPLHKALVNHSEFQKLQNAREMERNRMVFRWHNDRSYSSNVFYKKAYLEKAWNRFLTVREFHHRLPGFQDVLVMQKPK